METNIVLLDNLGVNCILYKILQYMPIFLLHMKYRQIKNRCFTHNFTYNFSLYIKFTDFYFARMQTKFFRCSRTIWKVIQAYYICYQHNTFLPEDPSCVCKSQILNHGYFGIRSVPRGSFAHDIKMDFITIMSKIRNIVSKSVSCGPE